MRHPVGSNILNQRRKTAALADVQTNQQAVAEPGKSWKKREETRFVKMACYGFNYAVQWFLNYRRTVNISQLLLFSLLTSFCSLLRKWNEKRKEKRPIVKNMKKLFFLSALFTSCFFPLSLLCLIHVLCPGRIYRLVFFPIKQPHVMTKESRYVAQ